MEFLFMFFFLITFFSAFAGEVSGVAHFAHLGGLLVGLVYLKAGGQLGSRLGDLRKEARGERRIRDEVSRQRRAN